jgi:hypothetical protein
MNNEIKILNNQESRTEFSGHFEPLVSKPPRVLVACEFSGIVREEFRKLGADAWSCDLLDTEIPGQHYKGDVLEILNLYWDLMIAHPPCTHLAVTGAPHFDKKKELQKQALEFVRKLMDAPIDKICIENPVSIISTAIRPPEQIIQPYYFGDAVPKRTCLWLKNIPALLYGDNLFYPTEVVEPEYLIYNSKKTKSGKSRYSVFGKLGKGHGKERSVTFPGIAKAMAEQWMPVISKEVC